MQTFEARARASGLHPLAAQLLQTIWRKKSNLCLSADVSTTAGLFSLVEETGEHICMVKTHADIVDDWGVDTGKKLRELCKEKDILIFEDRKFGDIGSTVQKQYTSGYFQIASWADVVNAHVFPGPAIVTALKKAAQDLPSTRDAPAHRGLLLLAEMSSEGNLMTQEYAGKCLDMARADSDFVMGFIAQRDLNERSKDQFLTLTPGVSLPPEGSETSMGEAKLSRGDGLGQQYNTPQHVIVNGGCDVIIVGRGIIKAKNPKAEAERYRRAAWTAYEEKLRSGSG